MQINSNIFQKTLKYSNFLLSSNTRHFSWFCTRCQQSALLFIKQQANVNVFLNTLSNILHRAWINTKNLTFSFNQPSGSFYILHKHQESKNAPLDINISLHFPLITNIPQYSSSNTNMFLFSVILDQTSTPIFLEHEYSSLHQQASVFCNKTKILKHSPSNTTISSHYL